MNTLHIIGNLTADPEIRTVMGKNGENTVCNLNVAVNRYVNGQTTVEYFRATLWNKQAENAAKYLRKGRKVAISGPVEGRAYADRDGKPRYSLEIRDVREIEYLGGRQEDEEPGVKPGAVMDRFTEVPEDDDLPF